MPEKVVGVLALQLPIDRVWQILTDTTGLGATGEILTAERIDNTARITTPLRHRSDAAYELTIPLTVEKAVAARHASSGNRGYAVFPDYRQEEVAAAWCYLPSYRWGLVAKQDTSEAFALVRFQQLLIAGLLCGGTDVCSAARLGVLIHGKTAEIAFEELGWFLAEDLLPYISRIFAGIS